MTHLAGKVALITGVSSGFGRACATVFASQGARVVGVARREAEGRRLEDEVRRSGGELTFVSGDVRRPEDCRDAVEAAVAAHGRLDVLVNNAGSVGSQPVSASHSVTEADWDDVVDTNLKGTFFCCRYAIPRMSETGGGVIVNIASINAVQAVSRMSAYNASKAAVLHLTRSLAVEYGEGGVRVNAIVLGGGGTPMATRVADEMAKAVRGPDYVRPPTPSRIDLTEFAGLVALLCSDGAKLLNGAVISVDRGISAGLLTSRMIWDRSAGLLDP